MFLNDTKLEMVFSTKFVNVITDREFTLAKEIESIKIKAIRAIGALYRIGETVDKNVLVMLYNTLVLLYLTYCLEV